MASRLSTSLLTAMERAVVNFKKPVIFSPDGVKVFDDDNLRIVIFPSCIRITVYTMALLPEVSRWCDRKGIVERKMIDLLELKPK